MLMIGGCGTPHSPPVVPIPEKWPHATQNVSSTSTLEKWWGQFHSPELNQLIKTGLQRNNQLDIAIARIEYARSHLQEIKLNWLPGLSVLGGYSQFPVLGNPGAMVIASPLYILNLVQQYKEQKSAQAQLKASYYAKEGVQLIIISQIASQFFTAIAQQEALDINQRLLQHYHRSLKLTRVQYHSGLIAEDTIDKLHVSISQIQAQITRIKNDLVIIENNLHYLLNENPGHLPLNTSFRQINLDRVAPLKLPVTVLNHRPDVQQAKAVLHAANADTDVVAARLLPSLTLGAYLGKGSSIQGPINLTEAYFEIPVVNLPVFAQIKASKAVLRMAWIRYQDTIRNALREVDNDLSTYQTQSQQLHDIQAAWKYEQQHCHRVRARYQHGMEDQLHVIQCQIHLDNLTLKLNQSRLEKILVLTQLYQDLGGGYCER